MIAPLVVVDAVFMTSNMAPGTVVPIPIFPTELTSLKTEPVLFSQSTKSLDWLEAPWMISPVVVEVGAVIAQGTAAESVVPVKTIGAVTLMVACFPLNVVQSLLAK